MPYPGQKKTVQSLRGEGRGGGTPPPPFSNSSVSLIVRSISGWLLSPRVITEFQVQGQHPGSAG